MINPRSIHKTNITETKHALPMFLIIYIHMSMRDRERGRDEREKKRGERELTFKSGQKFEREQGHIYGKGLEGRK